MTPSEERKLRKDIKDLLAANADLDARQQADIESLKKRIEVVEKCVFPKPVAPEKPIAKKVTKAKKAKA